MEKITELPGGGRLALDIEDLLALADRHPF